MSSDKNNEYFSDGMTEEITTQLSKIADLKVIARTSAFAFKGKNEDIRKIAETLSVGTILEGSVRRLLTFCGLEFEPQCIEFHKTVRSVRTASSEQVRQPIYREGLDQWKNYEPWLAPLRQGLGDALTRYRD